MFIDKSGRDATIKQTVIDVTESYANMKFAVCFFYLAVTFFVPPTLCKTLRKYNFNYLQTKKENNNDDNR